MSDTNIVSVRITDDEAGLKAALNDGAVALISFFGELTHLGSPKYVYS